MWFPIISLFPVPTLEEEEGDEGEPHTFSNESSSYTERRRGR
jgi:hypothetical protein